MEANRLDALYKAIHYYQKQGLCEGDEYELLDAAYEEVSQQQAEIERLKKDISQTIYDFTLTQIKLNSALQTIEAYKPMEQELERLNRAYEVLNVALVWYTHNYEPHFARNAIEEAQRLKEGDGEQG